MKLLWSVVKFIAKVVFWLVMLLGAFGAAYLQYKQIDFWLNV